MRERPSTRFPRFPYNPGMRLRSESGQAATENLAVIAVLVIAIVGATYTFVPTFSSGVDGLAKDVKYILATGKVGDLGVERGSNDDGINDGDSAARGRPESASGDEADSGAGGDYGDTRGGREGGRGPLGGSAADSAASRQMAEGSSQGSDTTPISREKTDDPTAALPGGPGGMGAAVSP